MWVAVLIKATTWCSKYESRPFCGPTTSKGIVRQVGELHDNVLWCFDLWVWRFPGFWGIYVVLPSHDSW